MTPRRRYAREGQSFTLAALEALADACERDGRDSLRLAGDLKRAARQLECPACSVVVLVPVDRTSGELRPLEAYVQHELTCRLAAR